MRTLYTCYNSDRGSEYQNLCRLDAVSCHPRESAYISNPLFRGWERSCFRRAPVPRSRARNLSSRRRSTVQVGDRFCFERFVRARGLRVFPLKGASKCPESRKRRQGFRLALSAPFSLWGRRRQFQLPYIALCFPALFSEALAPVHSALDCFRCSQTGLEPRLSMAVGAQISCLFF